MRAVVVVEGKSENGFLMGDRYPVPMLWLVDRPLIQQVCESLVRCGVRMIDWVHHHATEGPKTFLGDGERWGARFLHHTADGLASPYQLVQELLATCRHEKLVFLGHANRTLSVSEMNVDPLGKEPIRLFESQDDLGWSGWASFTGDAITRFPGHSADRFELEQLLYSGHAGPWRREAVSVGPAVRCLNTYLRATWAALNDRKTTEGDSIARSARIHPSARLIGPVFLGANVEIGAGATVGPNAAIGANSIIDRYAGLTNAIVLPDTYIGGRLCLDHAVADRDRIVSCSLDGMACVDRRVPVAWLADPAPSPVNPTGWFNRVKSVARMLGMVPTRRRSRASASHEHRPDRTAAEPIPVY